MDYGKKTVRNIPKCLECGTSIRYGRADKKYCCEDCKNRHHNRLDRHSRSVKRRILNTLNKNYEVLDSLIKEGRDSISLIDAVSLGFAPKTVTAYCKVGRHDEYTCFDIKYIMTPGRLTSISKIQNVSISLQNTKKH